jgi:hypothetical protein
MNKAIELVSNELNVSVPEFTVSGIPYQSLFAHKWYVGCDEAVDPKKFADQLDFHLQKLNDDYAVERIAALGPAQVEIFPSSAFYKYMESKGKIGGQNKFPRVLRNAQLDEWKAFLSGNHK